MAEESNQSVNGSWLKLYRKLKGSWINERPDFLFIWINLLMDAAWQDNNRLKRGEVKIDRKWFEAHGISRNVLDYFLAKSKQTLGILHAKRGVISICNWEEYQPNQDENSANFTQTSRKLHANCPESPSNSSELQPLRNRNKNKNIPSSNRKGRNPETKPTTDHMWRTYEDRYGYKPPKPSKGFWDQIDSLVSQYSGEQIREAWDRYLSDSFWGTKRHPVQTFVAAGVIVQFIQSPNSNWETEYEKQVVRAPR